MAKSLSLKQILKEGNELYGENPIDFTDKECATGHSYGDLYEREIVLRKGTRLLEIGISSGGSLWTWRRYLKDYSLTAVDLSPIWPKVRPFQQELEADANIELRWNSNSTDALSYQGMEPFDYIIDDGDHNPQTQADTFTVAYGLLKPGGTYFIEDVVRQDFVAPLRKHINTIDPNAVVEEYLGHRIADGRWDDIVIIVRKPK